MQYVDLFLAALLAVLVVRIAWLWSVGRLSQPADWSATERLFGRLSAGGLAVAALVSGVAAAYVATRVPWVDNFSALMGMPPVVSGRPTVGQSTASYLFGLPIRLGLFAAWMTDPWTLRIMSFRGSRDLVLRVIPVLALIAGGYSVWSAIGALAAATP